MSLPDLRELTTFDSTLREVAKNSDAMTLAIRQAEDELEKAEATNNERSVISLLGYLGNACRIANLLGDSIKYLRRAVFLSQTVGDRKAELVNTIRLAEARKYNGEHTIAQTLLRSVLDWTNDSELSTYKDFVLQHLAKCRLEQGEIDDAIQLLEEALKLRLKKGDQELIISTELALQQARKVIGSPRGTVHLEPYNPFWKNVYEQDEKLLRRAIGEYVVDIQHVGSTSIAGIEAKLIIDIAVAVNSFEHLDEIVNALKPLGYFRLRVNIDGKVVFAKDTDVGRTHYIHLELHNGIHWHEHITFRDYLRSHPEAAVAYLKMKRQLSTKYSDDVKSYTDGKRSFVDEVLQKAKDT